MPLNRMYLKSVRSVGFVDRGACGGDVGQGGADITLFKRGGDAMSDDTKATAELEAAQKRIEELEAKNADLEAENSDLNEKVDSIIAESVEVEEADDDVLKSADPKVRALFEKQEAEKRAQAEETRKAREEAAEAKKLAEAETEKRETREWVEKAGAYRALPVDVTAFGPVLRKAHAALSDDEFGVLGAVLKAGDEALAKGFDEIGKSNVPDADSAIAEVEKRAKELVSKGTEKSLPAARFAVRKADRDLAERERAELRG